MAAHNGKFIFEPSYTGIAAYRRCGPLRYSSSMQQQSKAHTGQGSGGDNHEEFEASPHGALVRIASFDRSQYHGSERGESICPPPGLWQGEQDRYGRDETPDHKGQPDL